MITMCNLLELKLMFHSIFCGGLREFPPQGQRRNETQHGLANGHVAMYCGHLWPAFVGDLQSKLMQLMQIV